MGGLIPCIKGADSILQSSISMLTLRETTYVQACSHAIHSRSLAASADRANPRSSYHRRGARRSAIRPASAVRNLRDEDEVFEKHRVSS